MLPQPFVLPIGILSATLAFLFMDNKGLMKLQEISTRSTDLERSIASLEAENRNIDLEIQKLGADPRYIEQIARDEYGYVKSNELVFEFQ